MEENNGKRSLEYHSIEIITDEPGGTLVVVKFKSEDKDRLGREHSWCPTLQELAFLYRTTKIMKRSTSRIQNSKT